MAATVGITIPPYSHGTIIAMSLSGTETFIYAAIGGLFPALIWLSFFLNEDRKHPEPRILLFITFIVGMCIVLPTLKAEQFVLAFTATDKPLFLWAFIEELFKYLAVMIAVLWRKEVDEPIDLIIYMITAALGFAAAETILFLLKTLDTSNALTLSVLTTSYRAVGAALLHTLASGIVGVALAFTFYKNQAMRFIALLFGLGIATLLHALFNFFIITSFGTYASLVFFGVWIGIVALLLMFEKAKRVHREMRQITI